MKSFLLLSEVATKGQVFQTHIPNKLLSSLFPRVSSASKFYPESCIVACDSGEIILVLLDKTNNFAKVCQSQGIVVWASFLNDYFILVESCGRLSVGYIRSPPHFSTGLDLSWRSVTLPLIPICCSALEAFLVLSDGYSSYLYEIQTNECQGLTDKLQRLSLCGVIQIKEKASQFRFLTCDGRSYVRSLQALQEDAQKNVDQVSQSLYIPDLNLEGAMEAIKRFSELSKKEKANLEKVNSYLEQISVAQMLLSEPPSELFCVKVLVSTLGSQEGYPISIHLKRLSSSFKFRGPWWLLNVKLKDCHTLNCEYGDFEHLNFSNLTAETFEVTLLVPFNAVEKLVLECNEAVNLEFYLTFSHFSLEKPLCTIKIQEEPLDILHFLTSIKNFNLPPLFASPFATKVSQTFETLYKFPSSVRMENENESPLSYHKVFLLLRGKHFPVLEKLFCEMPSSQNKAVAITRWLQNIPLNLSCEKVEGGYYKISVEGISREAVVAVKSSIERRALTNVNLHPEETENVLELPLALYRKAHVTKVILNLETSQTNPSESILKRIYDSVDDLISGTPL